jgi:predicted transcriptional regulator
MASSPFSVRLDEELKSRLEVQAERENRSSAYIVQQALESYLGTKDQFYRDMKAAIAKADEGIFISEEAMDRWMDSWDTENELPPPKPDIFPPGYEK